MYLKSKITQKLLKKILAGLMVSIAIATTSTPAISQDRENYGEALQKSILFYEAQQAGKLPEWNRIPWRDDATLEDGADVGVDLSGGWLDAGDNVKFNFPMAYTVTTLAWGGIEYYDAYQKSGQLEDLSQNIKWVTDYLLNSFANDKPGEYVLYGQVGNGKLDHKWWGAAEVVHYEMDRPAYKIDTSCPGTDLAGETSAALASSSILFRANGDPKYADLLVEKAEKLFDFANTYRGKYSDCLKEAVPFYTSVNGDRDELTWSAIWLHKAKKAQNNSYSGEYLTFAEAEYQKMDKPFNYTYQFDDKSYGVYILLAQETGKLEYQQRAEAWLDFWTVGHQGQRIKYTPGGLAFLVKWGSLPLSANTSFLAFVYSDWLKKTQGNSAKAQRYYDLGVSQINYILGQNPSRRSYMIGYGDNYPQNPHHRTAHGSWLNSVKEPQQTRNLLIGALVGGPDGEENWEDDRNDWVRNEVGVTYNAGLTGALAKMYEEFGGEPLAEISFPKSNDPEIYVESKTTVGEKQNTEIDLTIINKSAAPAQGLENAMVRVVYEVKPERVKDISTFAVSNDCANSPSKVVKLKEDTYYTDVVCRDTVIYPGGDMDYKKQITLTIDLNKSGSSNLFDGLSKMFAKPVRVTKICLYDDDKLLWESQFEK
ncbi:glycoside hydrolase family 9 protein [Waterburya agarophytonicola K14]|uniref:Endoglucanase n=1 Tax=Waterburya agarophytonicola KI4 TaxID=2874699 RepID=A0A964BR15_9CYAN|nr:glycoside hydrolase family 9 protein [Waterburya agarophytonicola]MCC0176240.1 glycoside hydrolase family 9 protein [Waterburya agarophytonicola KI4]